MPTAEIIFLLLLAAVVVIKIFDFAEKGFISPDDAFDDLLLLLPVNGSTENVELLLMKLLAKMKSTQSRKQKIIILLFDENCVNADICRKYCEENRCFEAVSQSEFEHRLHTHWCS